jgi:predicted alternative tryptophan synthase beta-subunit
MSTGRSSYVEMRSLDRLTNHNIKRKVQALRKSARLSAELEELLTRIPPAVSDGYTKVLTPNGIVRENELDRLLSIDADIVMCLGMIDPEKSQKIRDAVETLKELLEERKKLVDSLKA